MLRRFFHWIGRRFELVFLFLFADSVVFAAWEGAPSRVTFILAALVINILLLVQRA